MGIDFCRLMIEYELSAIGMVIDKGPGTQPARLYTLTECEIFIRRLLIVIPHVSIEEKKPAVRFRRMVSR